MYVGTELGVQEGTLDGTCEGIVVGMFVGIIFLNTIDKGLQEYFITRPEVGLGTALFATLVLIIFGVIAGYIPAKRAAEIKPIVALNDE